MRRELSIGEKHQLKIAKATLRMPDAMAAVMQCGVDSQNNVTAKAGARAFLRRIGWSDSAIAKLESGE